LINSRTDGSFVYKYLYTEYEVIPKGRCKNFNLIGGVETLTGVSMSFSKTILGSSNLFTYIVEGDFIPSLKVIFEEVLMFPPSIVIDTHDYGIFLDLKDLPTR
jgi:hypothetical protein